MGPHTHIDAHDGRSVDSGEVRGTQSFVHTLSSCWQRPSLTALEVLWRWVYGVPVLLLIFYWARRVQQETGLDVAVFSTITPTDPMGAAAKLAEIGAELLPPVLRVLRWLGPVLVGVWVVVSSVGRTLVLRRADGRLQARPVTLMALAVNRIAALLGTFALWFVGVRWAAATAVTGPLARGGEPNLVLYFAMAIVGTLALFIVWAVVSWVFSMAPLLAMLRGLSAGASLRAAMGLGPLKAKLVEVNLVMGIVKIALIVLAMVLSACPLPFESVMTQEFLEWWWLCVSVAYCVGSDFFHVARLVAYLNLWREYEPG